MPLKIVFAFAAPKRFMKDPSCGLLPLGLLRMGALLEKKGHDVQIIHLSRFGWKDALKALSDGPPDIAGFSCFTFQRSRTLETARRLREKCGPGKPLIIMGGPHAGAVAHELLSRHRCVDGVVRGEGEKTVSELAECLCREGNPAGIPGLIWRHHDGSIAQSQEREPVEDLNRLPSVASSDVPLLGVNLRFQLRHLVTGRGCTGACSFCYAPQTCKGKVKRFSVNRIVSEIKELQHRYSIHYLSFRDDSFTENKKWICGFSEALIHSRSDIQWDCQSKVHTLDMETVKLMRSAGCVQIQMGVESGSQRMLEKLRKPYTPEQLQKAMDACRKTGMLVSFYLISGIPGETDSDIEETKKLVHEMKPDSLVISQLVLYPGTELAAALPASKWFEHQEEELYARTDRQTKQHDQTLRDMAEKLKQKEPFTEDDLKQAVTHTEGAVPVKLSLAQFYENTEKTGKAEEIYKEILNKHPGYLWAELQLGELLAEIKKTEESLLHLERAREKAPRWPYVLSKLSAVYAEKGNRTKSEALLEKARRLTFNPEA